MPPEPAELWAFFVVATTVVAILGVAVGAAVIVSQRKMTAATRDYAARQVAALEEERGRVARELHDDVSQQIAVLTHQLEAIHESLPPDPGNVAFMHAADMVGDGLRDLANTVRDLAHRMHPSALEHLGLGPALKSLAGEMTAGVALQIEVDVVQSSEIRSERALALYRVAQEALRNVRKHAGATMVAVSVSEADGVTMLEVSDNGGGFPAGLAAKGDGLGMVSMRERVRLVGGDLSIASKQGQGTTVRAWVPQKDRGSG